MSLISFLVSRFAEHLGDLVVMIGLVVILGILELLLPAEQNQSLRGRIRNLEFTALSQLGGGILVSLVAYLVLPYLLLPSEPAFERSALDQTAVILVYVFLGDLVFYWYHRAQHAVPALWTIHELHHSDDELNATSSLRRYLLERPLQFGLISLPIAIIVSEVPALHWLRLTEEAAGRLLLVSIAWLLFAHANLRLELGRWSWIATGPQLHRIHHSVQAEHHGKNFAQFFPIIDLMFGTYHAPRRGEFPATGTDALSSRASFRNVLARPFAYWLDRIRRAEGRSRSLDAPAVTSRRVAR